MQHIWLVYLPGNQYSWASSMLMQWWTSVRGNSSCILQDVWHVWPLVILCIADDAAMCYTDHWPRLTADDTVFADDAAMCYTDHWPRLTTGDTVYCWWCSHVLHWPLTTSDRWWYCVLLMMQPCATLTTDHWPRLTTGDTVYCWWCSHVLHWSTDHWVAAQICSSLVQSCHFCLSFFLNLSEKVGAVYVREHVVCSSTRELADEQMIILSFNRTVTSQILSPERAL